ncbi:UDP-N-acetylmuramate dehydrogenase [Pectinatus sottacetonis]|uniref:UDP-N-acetylmuramate dehydrogenase n=1 Tax=Pectinatus sottacetonis TaxID=1002795 RepID=UPI0018C554BD|nr:UDP-N-acetylmuramate dehydrogenase [Pectinatus sottacetonis]
MSNLDNCIRKLKNILPADRLLIDAPMSEQTTFKIGGPADCLLFPDSTKEIKKIITIIKSYHVPCTIIGNGSNILVLDKGIRGIVIKFGKSMSYIHENAGIITTGCGTLLNNIARFAAANSLTGLEFAVGIPGSIGGAVYMNAGAYGGEIKNVVKSVTAVTPDGKIVKYPADKLQFDYRKSIFQINNNIICEIEFALKKGLFAEINALMSELIKKRKTKQPLEFPSAGSTFKRPPGYYAGTLIDQTGLKGLHVGGAQVSTKHAGFVVNTGNATAKDVLALIVEIQKRVYEKHGVKLYPEVRLIGEE